MTDLAITGIGMITAVGPSAPVSCAAVRACVDNFRMTAFRDNAGAWLMGSEVDFERPWRGTTKLVKMLAASLQETLDACPCIEPSATPLILCLAEGTRPGRPVDDDRRLFAEVQAELGVVFHPASVVVPRGRVSTAVAIAHGGHLLATTGLGQVIVAGADTLLVARALRHHERRGHLLTSLHSDGFIPGEAAGSFVVARAGSGRAPAMSCIGVGFGVEKAHIDSDEPLRADGLTAAIKGALDDAGCCEQVLKFKIIDASGSQYQFKEASLAFARLDRTKRKEFGIWHPADCVGEVGAAVGPVMIGALYAAYSKGYAPGDRVLMHLGNDGGERAALIFGGQAKVS